MGLTQLRDSARVVGRRLDALAEREDVARYPVLVRALPALNLDLITKGPSTDAFGRVTTTLWSASGGKSTSIRHRCFSNA